MNTQTQSLAFTAAFGLAWLTGCVPDSHIDIVAEGVIYSAEFEKPGGGTEGFTRLNNSKAVPGGNGSWNIDAYGRLTRDFLIITRPQQRVTVAARYADRMATAGCVRRLWLRYLRHREFMFELRRIKPSAHSLWLSGYPGKCAIWRRPADRI